MKNYLFFFMILVLGFQSCKEKIKSKEELKAMYLRVEADFGSDSIFANQFIQEAQKFIHQPNQDSNKVHFRKLLAETYTMQGKYDRAIEAWDSLRIQHSSHPLAAEALFKKAFLLSEMKNLKRESLPLYEEFIVKYPNHPYLESAMFQIANMGKPNEMLLNEILEKAESTDSTNRERKRE